MRKKIEELRNREEGFTLVELLAVIVILGIIVAIAIPAIGSVIDRADEGATDAEQALVEDATRLYVTTSGSSLDWTSDTETVLVETLYSEGFLEDRDGEPLAGSVKVTRTKTDTETESEIYKYVYDAENVTQGTGD